MLAGETAATSLSPKGTLAANVGVVDVKKVSFNGMNGRGRSVQSAMSSLGSISRASSDEGRGTQGVPSMLRTKSMVQYGDGWN